MKTTSLVGESTSVSYGKYADNGGYIIYIADVRFFEDGSFVTSNEPVDCPDELDEGYRTEATTFYDSKGNEAKRIIVIYYDAPSSLGQMWPSAKLYGWNGTAWERISSFDWYSKASENLRYNYSYNSEGYIESSEFYQYYDDRYVLVSDTRTSYSDNGYTNEYWSLKGEIGMPGAELSKVKSEEYSLLENDTVCFTVYNYSDDNVVSCVKTKSKDEIYWYYMFDGNSFVLYNIQYLPIYTTYENGIETTIERYIDSNWNIVNTTKSVYGVIDHGMSFYSIITPEYLNDNDLPGTDIYKTNMVSEINETYEFCHNHGIDVIGLTSNGKKEIDEWNDLSMAAYPMYIMDDSELKMVARGNPAAVLLSDGKIVWKRTLQSIPIDRLSRADDFAEVLGWSPHHYLYFVTTLYLAAMLLVLIINRTHIVVKFSLNRVRKSRKKQVNLQSDMDGTYEPGEK